MATCEIGWVQASLPISSRKRTVVFLRQPHAVSGSVKAFRHRKQRKLRSLAIAWLRDHDGFVPRHDALRFDVVGVRIDAAGRPVEWEHVQAAF